MKTKGTAALLAILLGGIGGHKFYLGQSGQGIMYLLFCWTFIPGLIAFFEFFMLLMMDKQEFDRRFNHQGQAAQGNQMGQNVTINLGQDELRKAGAPRTSITAELKELKELHVAGALTDQEFLAQKQRLLSE